MASHCIPSQGCLLGTELHTRLHCNFQSPKEGIQGGEMPSRLFNTFISSLDEGPLKQRKCPALEPTLLHMSQHWKKNKSAECLEIERSQLDVTKAEIPHSLPGRHDCLFTGTANI